MKISIDTKEDSHDDIKKVIKMLEHLVGSSISPSYSNQGNIFDDPSPGLGSSEDSAPALGSSEPVAPTNAFSAMFSSEEPAPVEAEEKKEMSTYGENEVDDRKFELDDDIVPY
jgi:hypothetical protein